MSLRAMRAWLVVGGMALGACSDSHEAENDEEIEEATPDPIRGSDPDPFDSRLDAGVSVDARSAEEPKAPEGMPGPGPNGAVGDGREDGGKRDRALPEAGTPKPKPGDPKHDGGPVPPKPVDPKLDGGPMPKPEPKHDGGPRPPKPDEDVSDGSLADAASGDV
jgi:hypothetical protein